MMTNQHPMIPTNEQFAEWDAEYFDGERQNFDFMMLTAFQAGADRQLEQVIDWIRENLYWVEEDGSIRYLSGECVTIDHHQIIDDLKKAMRPQEES